MYKAQDAFGGRHTVEKLDRLKAYLKAYLKVLKNQDFHTIYFDAFAGTGIVPADTTHASLPLGDEDKHFIVGSAKRALSLDDKFSEYIFVEAKRKKARELESVKLEFPDKADCIRIRNADANLALQSFCNTRNWKKCRAVVFFGSIW